jgi:hypothetical protein
MEIVNFFNEMSWCINELLIGGSLFFSGNIHLFVSYIYIGLSDY